MKKLLALLMVFVLSFGVIAAQDDATDAEGEMVAPTIAEVVVESANAEEPEFATLLTAVQAAAPAVLEALGDPEAELTVFAPTDAAFAALAEALGEEAFGELLANEGDLTDVLLYHVLEGAVDSATVVGLLEEGAFTVETLNGQRLDVAGDTEAGITIDSANLVLEMVDIEAANGIIHVIDAVLVPEFRTVAEIVIDSASLEEGAEFTTLLTAVQAADPAVLELLSDETADLTVFAPTDEAFAALGDALGDIVEDTELLTTILQYHVLVGSAYSDEVLALFEGEDDMMLETVEIEMASGDTATLTLNDDGLFINGAQIITTDIEADNGVIHVIDAVITPPADME